MLALLHAMPADHALLVCSSAPALAALFLGFGLPEAVRIARIALGGRTPRHSEARP